MATTNVDVKNAIVKKLQGVGHINGVYPYEIVTPTNGQYPFCTVIVKKGEAKFGDTIRNLRTFTFQVNVYQERVNAGQGDQAAEVIVDGIVDEVATAFDMDTTLSGLVQFVKPISFDTNYVSREIGDTRICQFMIEATVLVPSIT